MIYSISFVLLLNIPSDISLYFFTISNIFGFMTLSKTKYFGIITCLSFLAKV